MQPDAEMFDRLRKAEMQISTHEAVCVERYNSILTTHADIRHEMRSINKLIKQVGWGLLVGMGAILSKMVFHG